MAPAYRHDHYEETIYGVPGRPLDRHRCVPAHGNSSLARNLESHGADALIWTQEGRYLRIGLKVVAANDYDGHLNLMVIGKIATQTVYSDSPKIRTTLHGFLAIPDWPRNGFSSILFWHSQVAAQQATARTTIDESLQIIVLRPELLSHGSNPDKRDNRWIRCLNSRNIDAIVPVEEVLRILLRELSLQRHAGPYPAQPHDVARDMKWLHR